MYVRINFQLFTKFVDLSVMIDEYLGGHYPANACCSDF